MRILIIEDEHTIAAAIKKGLEHEHFEVDVVHDGQKGFDLASTEPYNAIILDLLLPSMDGLEICKQLRKLKIHTPILILTAKSESDERVVGLNTGADDYLSKPFSLNELIARIRALTRRPLEIRENELIVDDLVLHVQKLEVRRSGKVIHLARKEYALLEYLMQNPNRTLTREQIMLHVWDYDSTILSNAVDVYIRYLRNKIDVPFPDKKPLIHTIRGFGYKIGM